MINEFKMGDVITNIVPVFVTADGWIFTDDQCRSYPKDTTYPAGDYWIVESIGERYCLIHMSGRKAKLGDNTLQWNFRLD